MKDGVRKRVAEAVAQAGFELSESTIALEHPDDMNNGDYSTNVALMLKGGKKLAEQIATFIRVDELIAKIEVAGPGFINIWLQNECLVKEIEQVLTRGQEYGKTLAEEDRRVIIEFAHPNTHKELHIGHMRTLITGESIARIKTVVGATVFRANYQGDIGPHVAKAIWGLRKLLLEKNMGWLDAEQLMLTQKARLLGEGYVRGNLDYEENKEKIDQINKQLYEHGDEIWEDYERTRRWSLEYYDMFYSKFGTRFDKLFFESEVADRGKKIVEEQVGKVFELSDGAVIFPGDKYGLHNRVFITSQGNPTYEGKEVGLGFSQREVFEFDNNIHVVANEQASYFQVVIKALELIDPWFVGRETHLSMGMVNLVGRKISSRTGDVVTVDGLLDEVKESVRSLIHKEGKTAEEVEDVAEKVTLAAVKYSILKNQPSINSAFDIKQSVSLEGNSGPYLQYTFARIQSVLAKSDTQVATDDLVFEQNDIESSILRYIYRYSEIVEEAALRLAPNLICGYLYTLAQRFNTFYNQFSILSAEKESTQRSRLALTAAVGQVIKNGLNCLGIEAPERM